MTRPVARLCAVYAILGLSASLVSAEPESKTADVYKLPEYSTFDGASAPNDMPNEEWMVTNYNSEDWLATDEAGVYAYARSTEDAYRSQFRRRHLRKHPSGSVLCYRPS